MRLIEIASVLDPTGEKRIAIRYDDINDIVYIDDDGILKPISIASEIVSILLNLNIEIGDINLAIQKCDEKLNSYGTKIDSILGYVKSLLKPCRPIIAHKCEPKLTIRKKSQCHILSRAKECVALPKGHIAEPPFGGAYHREIYLNNLNINIKRHARGWISYGQYMYLIENAYMEGGHKSVDISHPDTKSKIKHYESIWGIQWPKLK
jgi:hypothetical protein